MIALSFVHNRSRSDQSQKKKKREDTGIKFKKNEPKGW